MVGKSFMKFSKVMKRESSVRIAKVMKRMIGMLYEGCEGDEKDDGERCVRQCERDEYNWWRMEEQPGM